MFKKCRDSIKCSYFGQHPKRKRSISPSKFDGQLSNILFTYLCLCVWIHRDVMVLVEYGSNNNRLRVWGKLDWIICYSDCNHLHQRSSSFSLPVITNFINLREKESVVVSPVITVILWWKRERLKQCHSSRDSLVFPWGSLNWVNGWGRENAFGADCWDGCTQK